MKKIPMRKCVATQEQCPKKELLRIVRTPEGTIEVDTTGKLNGRGAYLKKDEAAVELAKKKGSLAKALECTIPDEVYEKIMEVVRG
ncbi:RNase P modulator RnpM [Anaerorhabdus furcosa]|uniref:YlxR domain-containing protein n=1 Tax=Anaerorhabdus furcosa TaxID=118967 RepID=A0A1T4Q171_9FIRM|nr:YlxR family protein [Anaerorhabdus furcosa]SJZ97522.1 hypothetical protein SAMN02745191_2258 [Anaerorhabdus furcosa]